jgi:hypothetical protein
MFVAKRGQTVDGELISTPGSEVAIRARANPSKAILIPARHG